MVTFNAKTTHIFCLCCRRREITLVFVINDKVKSFIIGDAMFLTTKHKIKLKQFTGKVNYSNENYTKKNPGEG